MPARRAFRRRDVFDTSFVAMTVSSVLDVASVVFTHVGDIAFVKCVSFVVVSVLAPKPTFTWPELDDDEDDDDDDLESSGTCEGEDPPEPVGAACALSCAVSNSF